jgi:hypothetical protein
MTRLERDEFWRRLYAQIERYRDAGAACEMEINQFEVRRWDVKFTMRRSQPSAAAVTLVILEHAPSKDQFLLAITATYTVEDAVTEDDRFLLPVFLNPASDRFLLHADRGPIDEAQMPEFFARTAAELLRGV